MDGAEDHVRAKQAKPPNKVKGLEKVCISLLLVLTMMKRYFVIKVMQTAAGGF